MQKKRLLQVGFLILVFSLAGRVLASCSSYVGLATINEVSKFRANGNNHAEDLVELKVLDDSIPSSVYSNWKIQICEDSGDGCTGPLSISSFDDTAPPWLIIKGATLPGDYISFDDGFDIIFTDAAGDTIDYLTYDGYEPQKDTACFSELLFDTASGKSGGGEKRIRRRPDGTGDWDFVTAQSDGDTEDASNDDLPSGTPEFTISDATVSPGQVATFTVNLSATHTEIVNFSFQTLDGTASAGSDYTYTTGSGSIAIGQTSATFTVPTSATASIGEIFYVVIIGVDNVVVTDQVGQATFAMPAVDHFVIDVGGGSGSVCTPQDITISVCADAGCTSLVADYTGTIDLTTSTGHGDWAIDTGSGSLSPSPDSDDNGAASYTFVSGDAGDVILDLSNAHAETLKITASDSSLSISDTSGDLTFSQNAFVISSIDTLAGDVVAGRDHSFRIQMMRREPAPDNSDCSVATDYTVADVKAWITRDANDPGGAAPNAVTASETQSLPNSEPGSMNLTLPFVAGQADFSLSTSDVGKYLLNFKDDSLAFSDQVIVGTTSNYVVRPFGFDVQVTSNPAATNENGNVFTTAGSNFTVTARAVAWASADDADDDGMPDNHDDVSPSDTSPNNNANLSNNGALPSFGQEGIAEDVILSAYLSQPVGGTDPGLSDGDASAADGRLLDGFSSGSDSTAQVNFPEVGIIEIAALVNDGSYLGAGVGPTSKSIGRSGYVGRFVPARFEIQNGVVTEANTGFTYLEQPFSVTFDLEAQNAAGVRTTNYTGVWAKLGNNDISYGLLDMAAPASLDARVEIDSTTVAWNSGLAAVSSSLNVDRAALQGELVDLELGAYAEDTEGAINIQTHNVDLDTDLDLTDEHVLIGTTTQRFGRLFISDAWGPESTGLGVPLRVEYWNGSVWIMSSGDETQILRTDITFTDSGGLGSDISGDPVTAPVGSNPNVAFTYDPTGNPALDFGDGVGGGNGDSGMFVGAPGATGFFTIDIDLTSYPWLRFDWDQDNDYTNDTGTPTATVRFETYRGHDRVIYWREVLQ